MIRIETAPTRSRAPYTALTANQIRLLHLQPANSLHDPLVAQLAVAPLHDELQFDAVSYAWDGAFNDQEIPFGEVALDGISTRITGNLQDALRRLRRSSDTRLLWADAVCINQDDVQEQSEQVALMAQVYSSADQVIVWLGEDTADRDGEHFFDCCRRHGNMVHKYPRSRYQRSWRRGLHALLQGPIISNHGGYLFDQYVNWPLLTWRPRKHRQLLKQFFLRRYFSRR